MSKRARPLAGVVLVAIALAACNAITGLANDYRLPGDDGGDGAEAGATPDGSTIDDSSSGTDRQVDGADGSDGGAKDADANPPDAAPTFCSDAGANVAICTDFEETNPLAKWDNGGTGGQIKGGNGSISVIAGMGVGGSKAYRAIASDALTDRTVALWKAISNVPTANARYTASFAFLIKKKTIDYGVLAALGFIPSFSPYYGLAIYPTTNKLDQSDPPAPSGGLMADGMLEVWHAATITFERIGATGPSFNSKLVVDGITVDELRPIDSTGAASTELRIGFLFTSTDSDEAEIYYDNVLVTRDP